MANYPAPPGHRMAYDRDGSVGFTNAAGVIGQLSGANLITLNDEDGAGYLTVQGGTYVGLIFPQLRDLAGYFLGGAYDHNWLAPGTLETSADTTTGQDGTWITRANPFSGLTAATQGGSVTPGYRSAINSLSVPGVKALRFRCTGGGAQYWPSAVHFYGDITAGQEGDSLALWNPTTDARLSGSALDFGDVPRSNVAQKQFRIKNRSTTKTANNVVIGLEALTDATPSLGSQHQFSLDGGTWASTVTVTAIAPGAISPIVYMRRSTDPAAALSVWAARITCVPGSWT